MVVGTIDLTSKFSLAYTSENAAFAKALFNHRSNQDANNLIAEGIQNTLSSQYQNLFKYLMIREASLDNSELCMLSLLKNNSYPITFYDFGVAGNRGQIIADNLTKLGGVNGTLINEIGLVDKSAALLEDALKSSRDSGLKVRYVQDSDFIDATLVPFYEETNMPILQADRISGEFLYANCRASLEKRVFGLLGRTLNNLESPEKLIEKISDNMTPLDILVIEARTKQIPKYEDSSEFFIGHVKQNIGLKSDEFRIYFENSNDTIKAYAITLKDVNLKSGNVKEGQKLLLAYNKPLNSLSLSISAYHYDLGLVAMQNNGADTIFYFSKHFHDPEDTDILSSRYRNGIKHLDSERQVFNILN